MAMVQCRWQVLLVGLCLIVSAGCTSGKRLGGGGDTHQPPLSPPLSAKPASVKDEVKTPDAPSIKELPSGYRISEDDPLVAARASFYEKTLNEWRDAASELSSKGGIKEETSSWRECLLAAEQALAGYHSLQAGQSRDVNPWQVVARDVGYYGKGCDNVLAFLQKPDSGLPADHPSMPSPDTDGLRAQLQQVHDSGDYQTVIANYEATFPPPQQAEVSREIKLIYGKSLVKIGRFEDAARVYTEILAEPGLGNDLETLKLRVETGDVLLAAGRLDDARQVYQGQVQVLSPLVSQKEWAEAHALIFAEQVPVEDMELYRSVMQAYLQFDGKKVPAALTEGVAVLEGRAPGPLLDLSRLMLDKVRNQVQIWARGQLTEIRSMMAARELEQARVLLEQVTGAALPEIMGEITQLQAELAQALAVEQRTPAETEAPEAVDPWQEAMALFEHQKYDEAIARFQQFLGTEREAEAQAKVAEAAEFASAALRRQAAALYAKARNTFDPEIKKQTLQDSRVLLEQIIEKYPQSSVVEKARQNLKVIEAELGSLSSNPSPQ